MLRLFILLTFSLSGFLTSSGNLIVNSSFEDADDGKPAGWLLGTDAISIEEREDNGKNCLRISHSDTGPNYSMAYQTVTVKPNTAYIAVCYARTSKDLQSASGGAPRLYITGADGAKELLVSVNISSPEWTKTERGFNSKENTSVTVRVYLHNSSGSVWYDDVEVWEETEYRTMQRGGAKSEKFRSVPSAEKKKTSVTKQTMSDSNLVKNPGFEEIEDDAPVSWEKGSDTIVTDEDEKCSGSRSIRITHEADGDNFSQIRQVIPVKPNTQYIASCYIKAEKGLTLGTGGAPRLYVTGVGGEQTPLVIAAAGPEHVKWTKLERGFNSGSYTEVNLRVYLHNTRGTVWFDDIILMEARNATGSVQSAPSPAAASTVTSGKNEIKPETFDKVNYAYSPERFIGGAMVHPDGLRFARGRAEYFYRRTFMLKKNIKNAWLQIGIDEGGTVFLNENELGTVKIFWKPVVYDITQTVRSGKNIIALSHVNEVNRASVNLDITVNYQDGTWERIVSDELFKSINTIPEEGWQKVNFDDSAWVPVALQTLPPVGVYSYRKDPPDYIEKREGPVLNITGISFPRTIKPLQSVNYTITFTTTKELTGNEYFYLRLRGEQYPVWEKETDCAKLSVKKLPDGGYSIFQTMPALPKLLPSMKLTLQMGVYGRRIQYAESLSPYLVQFINDLPKEPNLESKVVNVNGVPQLMVNGKLVFPIIDNRIGPPGYASLTGSGANIVTIWVGFHEGSIANFWYGINDYRFTGLDAFICEEIRQNPNAWIMLKISTQPGKWWEKLYPDDIARDDRGTNARMHGYSEVTLCSENWRRDAYKAFTAMFGHLENAPYASRIIGYCMNGGSGPEWHYWNAGWGQVYDYSPVALKGFRNFLQKDKGYSVQAAADTVIPSKSERLSAELGLLRDPGKNLLSVYYDQFLSQMVADAALFCARTAKELTGRKKIVGMYGAYPLETSRMGNYMWQAGGKNDFRRVFQSDDVDLSLGPQMYWVRAHGDVGEWMQAFRSEMLAGKLVLSDDDSRTYLSGYVEVGPGRYQSTDRVTSIHVMRRAFGKTLCRLSPISLLPAAGMRSFDDDTIKADLGLLQQYGRFTWEKKIQRNAEIAVIVDEESVSLVGYDALSRLGKDLINFQTSRLGKTGAPIDYLYFEDLVKYDLRYKMYVFLNCFTCDEKYIGSIRRNIYQKKATAVWLYAPGLVRGMKASPAHMEALTGMKLAQGSGEVSPQIKITQSSFAQKAGIDSFGSGGELKMIRPYFISEDSSAEVLGVYQENNQSAFSVKNISGSKIYFSGAPVINSEIMRTIARDSGIHIYCDGNDVLEANDSFIMFHASSSGKKTITLPRPSQVTDIFDKKSTDKPVKTISFSCELGETRVFYLGSNAELKKMGLL